MSERFRTVKDAQGRDIPITARVTPGSDLHIANDRVLKLLNGRFVDIGSLDEVYELLFAKATKAARKMPTGSFRTFAYEPSIAAHGKLDLRKARS